VILGELLLGALCSRVLWLACRDVFGGYVFQRRNYRDHPLPTGVGVLLPVAAAAVVALAGIVGIHRQLVLNWADLARVGPPLVGLVAGFAVLGLLDDMGGVGQSGGFRGHLRALFEGRLTTGALKLLGGPVVALAILARDGLDLDRPGLLRDAALISLAANLANLFDRAPGRVVKVGSLAFVALWATTYSAGQLAPTALVVGAAIGLLVPDLREHLMLGDAGSNALGAALGYGVVVGVGEGWRWGVVAVLALLNLASERVSFSRVIDAVPPLRWADRLGAPHRPH
jgi:UDP-N-acetylmuramyl pentapeptide phosphotransferase/UDP-N-acetylglucosamine-1-phosphate transferase